MERSSLPPHKTTSLMDIEVYNDILNRAEVQYRVSGASIAQFQKGSSTEFIFATKNGRIVKFFARLLNIFSKGDIYDKYHIGNTARQQKTAEEFHILFNAQDQLFSDNPPAKLTVEYLHEFSPIDVPESQPAGEYVNIRVSKLDRGADSANDDVQPQSFRVDLTRGEFDFDSKQIRFSGGRVFRDDADDNPETKIEYRSLASDDSFSSSDDSDSDSEDDADNIPDAIVEFSSFAEEPHNKSLAKLKEPDATANLPVSGDKTKK